jgi:hypothetical protein
MDAARDQMLMVTTKSLDSDPDGPRYYINNDALLHLASERNQEAVDPRSHRADKR